MTDPFPPPLREFVALFNGEQYWESHEVLERPWRAHRSDFYKGLILFASALVHVQRGNARGVRAQLRKARRQLEAFRPAYLGVDVDALLETGEQYRRVVEREGNPGAQGWAQGLPRAHLCLDPDLLSGDEPELRPRRPAAS